MKLTQQRLFRTTLIAAVFSIAFYIRYSDMDLKATLIGISFFVAGGLICLTLQHIKKMTWSWPVTFVGVAVSSAGVIALSLLINNIITP